MKPAVVIRLVAFALLCVFFWVTSQWLSALTDDAFISFRYARHLVDGSGLVFNPGEYVEGYTNLLWVLIMAAVYWLGLDMPLLSRVISTLCAAGLVVSMAGFSRSYFHGQPCAWISFLAPLLLALNPLFSHTVGFGLETVFFSLLVWWSVASYLNLESGNASPWATGALLGLAYLSRPEAVLWAGCLVAIDVVGLLQRERRAVRLEKLVRYLGTFGLIAALHLLWRVYYYGDLLPNTFYVKAGSNWFWGWLAVRSFVLGNGLLPLIAIAATPLVLRRRWAICVWLVVTLYLGLVLRSGGSRYLYPLLPLVYLLIQELFRAVMAMGGRGPKLLAAAGLCALFLAGVISEGNRATGATRFSRFTNAEAATLARCLRDATEPGDRIALIPAGVIPYYSERAVVDMLGLTDRHIGRRGKLSRTSLLWHQRSDSDYVLDRQPRVILVPPEPDPAVDIFAVRDMHQNPRFRELYVQTSLACEGRRRVLFVRRNRPLLP
jgi:arabinofuranosyltransferase